MNTSKVCFKCRVEKPLSDFYAHRMMADGRLNKCKVCTKRDVAEHRAANLEKIRAYDRERGHRPERIAAATRQTKKWRAEDRRRAAAHNAVARAIRSGKLKPQPCVRCGADACAHHESYDRKLDVTWLCQPHHKQRHKEMVLEGIEP